MEFALLQLTQQVDDLFTAIQCAINGNLSVKLIDPATLQNIIRNITLQLPDCYKLRADTRTVHIHQYYQIAKVSIAATSHCIKLIVSIPPKAAYQHFTSYKVIILPERITVDIFI